MKNKKRFTFIRKLAKRLKHKRYRAKLVRRCYIPKGDGKERPLGIPALEAKLVQIACAKILSAIFESDFVDTSYSYRTKRSAREAIQDLKFNLSVAPEKAQTIRFSRFHPGMQRRIVFLGFETYWMKDSNGVARVKQRTARKMLQGAGRRIKEWIKDNRHLKGRAFIEA